MICQFMKIITSEAMSGPAAKTSRPTILGICSSQPQMASSRNKPPRRLLRARAPTPAVAPRPTAMAILPGRMQYAPPSARTSVRAGGLIGYRKQRDRLPPRHGLQVELGAELARQRLIGIQ